MKVMKCAVCGEAAAVPICRSCGAELVAAAPDPTAERAATDRDHSASDLDQTLSDDDQTASDGDQSSSDRDQTASDADGRSSNEDQEAADDDLVAGSDATTHARTTRARREAAIARADASTVRDETGEERRQTANARDRAAAQRDRGAQRRDALASMRDLSDVGNASRDDLALRGERDRVRAAGDRIKAADDRARAAGDRQAAALERENASQAATHAAGALALAATDELTGARTRQTGLEDLSHELSRAHRTSGKLVLAFLDIDGLKQINDTHGHPAGDALLRLVGDTLHAQLRPYDVIVRYGGDEFVCAMPNLTTAEARLRLESIAAALKAVNERHSIAFGLTQATPADSLETLIARADDDLLGSRRAP